MTVVVSIEFCVFPFLLPYSSNGGDAETKGWCNALMRGVDWATYQDIINLWWKRERKGNLALYKVYCIYTYWQNNLCCIINIRCNLNVRYWLRNPRWNVEMNFLTKYIFLMASYFFQFSLFSCIWLVDYVFSAGHPPGLDRRMHTLLLVVSLGYSWLSYFTISCPLPAFLEKASFPYTECPPPRHRR